MYETNKNWCHPAGIAVGRNGNHEWIKVSGDSNWHVPSYAFSFQRLIENHPGQMLYVSTTGSFSGNGQLVTTSAIQGTTP